MLRKEISKIQQCLTAHFVVLLLHGVGVHSQTVTPFSMIFLSVNPDTSSAVKINLNSVLLHLC
jgi:hypothetical protein